MSLPLLKATGPRSNEAPEHLVQAPCNAPGWAGVLKVGDSAWRELCPGHLFCVCALKPCVLKKSCLTQIYEFAPGVCKFHFTS